ncbi:MAG: aspartate/glutamate racemase family protein [Granulosicoccus sp.]
MRILIINPNTTHSMTDKVRIAAEQVAPVDVSIHTATSQNGPASIQGAEDGEAAVPGLLAEVVKGLDQSMDAFVIACFDDTGLESCRELTDKPVIGIGEAAFHASMMLGHSFSIVTTLAVSIPVIEENLEKYALSAACRKVRASDVPVLALEEPGSDAEEQISAEISRSLAEDGSQAIVLGCAGMTDLSARLTLRHKVPVIDGVVAAVGMASALVRLQHSQQASD